MPHLVYAGRFWRIAGDEFSLPVLCSSVLRVFWTISLLIMLCFSLNRLSGCPDGWVLLLYLSISIFIFVLSIFCEAIIFRISLRGTPVDVGSRKDLSFYLSLHVVLGLSQLLAAIFGFFVAEVNTFPCSDEFYAKVDKILLSVVVISQLCDVLALLCCCYMFSHHNAETHLARERSYNETVEVWEKRCKFICKSAQICTCNIFGGSNISEDLEAVGRVLTNFFHHEGFLDVVASDVVAGIVLVRLQQRAAADACRSYTNAASSPIAAMQPSEIELGLGRQGQGQGREVGAGPLVRRELEPSNTYDFEIVDELAYYSIYALSIYSMYLFLYVNPCTGCCRLCRQSFSSTGCCACRVNLSSNQLVGDNCCLSNYTAMQTFLEERDAKVLYASFDNASATPFAVVLDRQKRTVVITVRGTMSLEDCVRDVEIEPTEMTVAGQKWGFNGTGRFAHKGMYNAALAIREVIENSGVLRDVLNESVRGSHASDHSINDPLNEYALVIVGHSLGAGCACLLAIMMRSQYPNLKCYSYGTPGSVVDKDTARDCYPYVVALSHADDIIPQLSLRSVNLIRKEILGTICRAKVNKMVIMQAMFKEYVSQLDDLMFRPGEEPESDFSRSLREFNLRAERIATEISFEPLHLPGRNFHLVRSMHEAGCCCSRVEYKMIESSAEYFSTIKIAPKMFWDHFPDRYYDVLRKFRKTWAS